MKPVTLPYRIFHWIAQARPIRFTRFGTFYILFSIAVGAAAINTGNNLLYLILGILLGFIVISGFLSDSGLWGIRTKWHATGSLYAGEKAAFECQIRKGWFPGVCVTVQSEWQGLSAISTFVPWIPAKGSVSQRVELTPQKRGYLTLESCRYLTRFPFGLFQKSHTWQEDTHWIVYPRLQRLPWNDLQRLGKEFSRDASSRLGQGSVPFVLRDYRTGDALRQVHWKASAKRQRLVVKEMEDEANEGDLFYLAAWPIDLDAQAMERFISFVASLVITAYERGRPVGLVVPERTFKPEFSRVQLHRVFEFLALIDPYRSLGSTAGTRRFEWNGAVTDVQSLWIAWGSHHAR